jgi:hypothetical protein
MRIRATVQLDGSFEVDGGSPQEALARLRSMDMQWLFSILAEAVEDGRVTISVFGEETVDEDRTRDASPWHMCCARVAASAESGATCKSAPP